jgi:putative ABC transport system permease protein
MDRDSEAAVRHHPGVERAGAPWALLGRALRARRARNVWALLGIAAAALLVSVLHGANRGVRTALASYLDRTELAVWVAPKGIDNLVRSGGSLPLGWAESVRKLPGVSRVDPVLRTFVSVEAGPAGAARKQTLLALFYQAPTGLGGPPFFVEGHAPQGAGEITVDRAAAYRLKVHAGDDVLVNGESAHVAGITRGTNLLGTQLVFGTFERGVATLGADGRASFLIAGGAEPERLAADIRAVLPEAAVYSGHDFALNSDRELNSGFATLTWLLSVVGAIVAALVVGLLVQGLVEDSRQDLAVLLALGASAFHLALALLMQAAGLVLAGSALGLAASGGLAAVLEQALPTVDLALSRELAGVVVGLFLAAGSLAGLAPIARVVRIEAMEAFRS